MAYLDGRNFQIDIRSDNPNALVIFNGDGTCSIKHIDITDVAAANSELSQWLKLARVALRPGNWILRALIDDMAIVRVQTRGANWQDSTQKHLVGSSWTEAWVNFQARITRYDQYMVKEGINQVDPIRFPSFQEYVRKVFPHDAQIFDQQDPSQLATKRALGQV